MQGEVHCRARERGSVAPLGAEGGRLTNVLRLSFALTAALALSSCDQKPEAQKGAGNASGTAQNAAPSCRNWTSSSTGSAQIGYFYQAGDGENPNSWNFARATSGCSEEAFHGSAGAGLFYSFALD
jgi:hypothetical protein